MQLDDQVTRSHYSLWAIASVVFNVPWLIAVGWVLRVYANAHGPIAGEIWLLPLMAYVPCGLAAMATAAVAFATIQASSGALKGRWLSLMGLAISAIPVEYGVFVVVRDSLL